MANRSYSSVFATEMQNFIQFNRTLGYKYEAGEEVLGRFDRFLVAEGLERKILTKELCDKWCMKKGQEAPRTQCRRISLLRVFSRYLNDFGFESYIPPKCLVKEGPRYVPHIYTDDELRKFFAAADQLQSIKNVCPYRSLVMPMFFRILYSSGPRLSELRLLRIKDMDLQNGFFTVRQAKNRKDRVVPVHPKLIAGCQKILESIHGNDPDPEEYFFPVRPKTPMSKCCVQDNFWRCLRKAGIPHTKKGPRIHDFRHTFSVNLLRKWMAEGRDLLAWLPYLSAVLGHETFRETAYYLRLTRQMMPAIGEQLDKKFPNMIKEVPDDEPEFY